MKTYVYKKTETKNLEIAVIEPSNKIYKKAPVYFLIPGGGWHMEKKEDMIGFVGVSKDLLMDKGYVVIGIDYRVVSDGAKMDDIIDDCFDALKYVSDNCDELGIDKNNIILCGHSAGGQLALMLAYTAKERIKDVNITAVSAMSPPTVLGDYSTHNLRDIDDVFKDEDIDSEKKKASPYEYVTPDCPPTILSAGTSDRLVYSNSSELLYKKLKENGVMCELLLSLGGGHCFEEIHDGITPKPSFEDIKQKTAEFILNCTSDKSEYC